MKKRITIFGIGLLVIVLAIVGFQVHQNQTSNETNLTNSTVQSARRSSHKQTKRKTKVIGHGKTLVVFFSYKRNSDGKPLKVGNTARIAYDIRKHTKADIYEIVPAKPYSGSYDSVVNLAQDEQDRNARPKIKNALPNVSRYKTVFFGGPIWWGEYPMIVYTFMDHENLNHKTLIPFTTAEGSGLGNTAEALRRKYPHAKVRSGFTQVGNTVKNHSARVAKQVNAWLKRLGY